MIIPFKAKAFTLSEMLVMVAIIGIIMALLIPMVIRGRESQTKRAVLKETITALSQVIDEGLENEQLQPGNGFTNYMLQRLTGDVKCNTNASAQGCWPNTAQTITGIAAPTRPGIKTTNGSMVTGLDGALTGNEWSTVVAIDWNGNNPPNIPGRDQLYLNLCYGANPCNARISNQQPATFQPLPASITGSADNTNLYFEIFPPNG